MIEISSAISSLATIKTLIEGGIAIRDETKLLEVKLTLMQQIFEVQRTLSALQDENAKVLQENRELREAQRVAQQFTTDVQGYEPFQAAPGVFVYALQTSDGSRPKLPYFCYACHKDGKQSILNFEEVKPGQARSTLQCVHDTTHRFELPRGYRRSHIANGVPARPAGAAEEDEE